VRYYLCTTSSEFTRNDAQLKEDSQSVFSDDSICTAGKDFGLADAEEKEM
jgi:hypothetical protein